MPRKEGGKKQERKIKNKNENKKIQGIRKEEVKRKMGSTKKV